MQLDSVCKQVVENINRHPARVIATISIIYFALATTLSLLKLFWFDEFITFYIAKLNSVHAIWAALQRAADPNPPLSHLLTMWSMRVFGHGPIAVRLPAIIAAWVAIVCLYVFLRRRVPPVYAAIGVAFCLATFAFTYAYESRSYALICGFAMLSLVLWRATIEGRHPNLAAAGLAIALAGGISSNYYGVLAFFPIAAGELVRTLQRRRIQWQVWAALAAGALPILAYMPLINHAVARFAPYAWNRTRADVITESYDQMLEIILYPALALMAWGVVSYIRERKHMFRATPPSSAEESALLALTYERRRRITPAVLPRHELVAVITLMAYPFIAYVIAVARAGMMSPRFVLPVCYGFAIAVAVTSYRLFSRNATAAVLLLVVISSWALVRDAVAASDLLHQRWAFDRIRNTLPATGAIAVTDALLAPPLYYYSPPQLASRIVVPLDFEAIRRYKGEDSPEENLWAGRGTIYPFSIVPLAQFEQTTPNYLVVTTYGNWLLQKLAEEGEPVHRLPVDSHSKDITGAFPLSHAAVFLWQVGATGRQQQYASATTGPAISPRKSWVKHK